MRDERLCEGEGGKGGPPTSLILLRDPTRYKKKKLHTPHNVLIFAFASYLTIFMDMVVGS